MKVYLVVASWPGEDTYVVWDVFFDYKKANDYKEKMKKNNPSTFLDIINFIVNE